MPLLNQTFAGLYTISCMSGSGFLVRVLWVGYRFAVCGTWREWGPIEETSTTDSRNSARCRGYTFLFLLGPTPVDSIRRCQMLEMNSCTRSHKIATLR
jgi:hypothetical protein